ncbi:MAG: MFS transporter [Aurantimonas endophytica]|uniref:MFS transporter n=1 Tax=Aurantimonas endophytica TaxID=1522175 RepID=UPI003002DA62
MTTVPAASESPPSTFAPLRHTVFAVLWAATVMGNTGTFMRDVASGWLVTDLSASPAAVAAIQAAGTLPIFLLSIPAGVLSDILDRRRFLIAIQLMLGCVSLTLCILALTGLMSVPALLSLTFVGGIGAALMGPTWQSIVPELVPRSELKGAVALNSLGINIARAIGPAVGGLLIATVGAAVTYGVDVVSYALVIAALVWWKRAPGVDDGLAESFGGAMRAGYRYARHSRELHVVLWRALFFFAFASAIWALLPLIARQLLSGGASFYGLLLGSIGAGAILGATVLPRIRARWGADGVMLGAALVIAAASATLALSPPRWSAVVILLVMGGAWIAALTTLNATAQAVLPHWVRGRGLAVYLMVFNGAMAGGSILWGLVAQEVGIKSTLLISAGALVAAAMFARSIPLPSGDDDLAPSNHWPEPIVAAPIVGDQGPVLIQIEYRIDPTDREPFLAAISKLAKTRLRDGAFNWGITEDAADPSVFLEWFMTESWAEHLRQHRRTSLADVDLHAEVRRFQKGDREPSVRHYLAATPASSDFPSSDIARFKD